MTRAVGTLLFGLLMVACVAAPALGLRKAARTPELRADWPTSFEGRAIEPIAPTPEDALLARGFPGRVARFSDGRRQIVLRRVEAATRRLHPARDCFRALGHRIEPAPMRIAPDRAPASCFAATRDGETLMVCEQVRDGRGASWPDISSWYWSALLGASDGPWLAALTVERVR